MATPPETIGVGLIGAGDISILHARAIHRVPGARLVGLWNRGPERAKERAAEFGCRTYATPGELVADPSVHAVFVLTNLETHHEYTTLALRAGKHVLVEKPVGVSVAEIAAMRDLAAEKGLVCIPGHNYVYEASMERTRELVQAGDLGKIVSVYVMYNIRHAEEVAKRFPGVVRQILTHHSYILLYLVGAPVELVAMKATLSYAEYPRKILPWCRCASKTARSPTSARASRPTTTRPTLGRWWLKSSAPAARRATATATTSRSSPA